jgi:protein arginine kinase activator
VLCERCNKNEATVHLTQAVDDEVTSTNLCEQCAQEAGIDVKKTISVTDILLGLEKKTQKLKTADIPPPEQDVSCSGCGITRHEYKKSGRLGCAECYQAFADDLDPLIRAMQRSSRHRGKKPQRHPFAACSEDVAVLQKALQQAVDNEQFEEAARLRDELKSCQNRAAPRGMAGE